MPPTASRSTRAQSRRAERTNSYTALSGAELKSPAMTARARAATDASGESAHEVDARAASASRTCASLTSPRFGLKSTCVLATHTRGADASCRAGASARMRQTLCRRPRSQKRSSTGGAARSKAARR